jgi:hypothetical protein
MIKKIRCVKSIYSDYGLHQCVRNATTNHDDKPYCKQHNPALRKVKLDANYQAYKAENDAKYAKQKTDAHKIAVHDELVSALQDVAQTLSWTQHGECRGFSDVLLTTNEALEKAQAALMKAKS